MPILSNLKHVGCVVGGCNAAGYIVTAALETHKLTDLVGVGSFVAATTSLAYRNKLFSNIGDVSNMRLKLVNFGIMIWGVRLATYLFTRVLKLGDDKRLDKFYRKPGEGYFDSKGANYPIRLSVFWSIQAMWGFVLLLPVTFLNSVPLTATTLSLFAKNATPLTKALSLLPIVGLYGGIVMEAVADYQKSKYRDNEANKGHWCDVGLFSLCRYPNYFAEILTWWSVYFACLPALSLPLAAVSLISPLFSSFIVLKLSGVPLLEKKSNALYGKNKEYITYVESTNKLIPFPKLFVGKKKSSSGSVENKKAK